MYICIPMYKHIYICTYVCRHMYVCMHMDTYIHSYTYKYLDVCMHLFPVHIYTSLYIYIHVYMYMRRYISVFTKLTSATHAFCSSKCWQASALWCVYSPNKNCLCRATTSSTSLSSSAVLRASLPDFRCARAHTHIRVRVCACGCACALKMIATPCVAHTKKHRREFD